MLAKQSIDFEVINGMGVTKEPRYIVMPSFKIIAIPARCHWNGSNIPRFLRWLFGTPFDAVHAMPSLDHDRLYEVGYVYGISRREADRKYYFDILDRGQNPVLAWLEWLNIRLFGKRYWEGK